jgi:AraC family transcriptional regulator, regulatory protein of adaptative response / methylated-DNA-[protein]-cysteine methyltransferase
MPATITQTSDLSDVLPDPPANPGADQLLITTLDTPLGPMVAGAGDSGLCLLEFLDRRALRTELADLSHRFNSAVTVVPKSASLPRWLRAASDQLAAYFHASLKSFTIPLTAPGTPFQTRVWDALNTIPYGQTRSYGDIARQIGQPEAVRAVGAANGANRIAIIIPCHRVIEANGKLRGYGGGLERKRALLDLESGADRLFAPNP